MSHQCGLCSVKDAKQPATSWCKDCQQKLCDGCKNEHDLSNTTCNHVIVPLDDHVKHKKDFQISEMCKDHNKKLSLYCKTHRKPCCSSCVMEKHKHCQDMVKLTDVILNAKSSLAIQDLETTLNQSKENITRLRIDREGNLESLNDQTRHLIIQVNEVRMKINSCLDTLQDSLIQDLKEKAKKETNRIKQVLELLKARERSIQESFDAIDHLKRDASDLQTFLGITHMEEKVHEIEKYVDETSKSDSFAASSLHMQLDPSIEKLENRLKTFGNVTVKMSLPSIRLARRKQAEAQTMIVRSPTKQFTDIQLSVERIVNNIGDCVFGSHVLPDGRTAFINFVNSKLKFYNTDGSEGDMVSIPNNSYDIVSIDKDTVAVSSLGTGIHLIRTKDGNVTKSFLDGHKIYGIAVRDENHLVFCEAKRGIQMIRISDGSITSIVRESLPNDCYLVCYKDRILQTNYRSNTINCYDFSGVKHWEFRNETILRSPHGISVDSGGNIYVAGESPNNLVIISSDGQTHRHFASALLGVSGIWSIHHERSANRILIANVRDKAVILKTS